MKRSFLLAAAALSAAPAAEARVGPMPRPVEPVPVPVPVPAPARRHVTPEVPTNCRITVAFGSYAAGIDGPTLARMERMLQSDRRVQRFTRHPWGREGEVTLCIYARGTAGAGPLARQLRAMIPARPRGPVTVSLRPNRVY
jgi:hypothetical protein